MNDESRASNEGLATVLTFIGFLPSVDSLMGVEVGAVTKAFPALEAFVGLLSRVNSGVGFQVGRSVELGPANVTTIGFLTCCREKNRKAIIKESFHSP